MMITLRSHITQSLHKKKGKENDRGFFCKEAKLIGDNRLKIFQYERKQSLNILSSYDLL